MSWTQPCCWLCWYQHNPQYHGRPHTLAHDKRVSEMCCYCGQPTISGIYIRADPGTVKYPTRDQPEREANPS